MFLRKVLFFVFLLFSASLFAHVPAAPPVCFYGGPIYTLNDDIARISPNPANEEFGIWAVEGITLVQVEMINQNAEVVRNVCPDAGYVSINTATLQEGVYILRITTNRAVHYTNMVIQH